MSNPVLVIAKATLREAARKKLVLALVVITVIGLLLTGFGFWRLSVIGAEIHNGVPRLGGVEKKAVTSQLLILVMFAFSFVLAISTVFMAAPTIAGELESGVAAAVLTRPIRRIEMLAGKWLGLAALTLVYVVAACGLEFVVVRITAGYTAPHPVWFCAFLVGEALVTLTLTTLISTRMSSVTGGVVALGGFMLAWMGGIAVAIGQALSNHGIMVVGTLTRLLVPTDGLWRGAIYALEPAAVIATIEGGSRSQAAANPFFAATGPPAAYLIWVVFWGIVVFGAAAWCFARREV